MINLLFQCCGVFVQVFQLVICNAARIFLHEICFYLLVFLNDAIYLFKCFSW
jgi:hypothetical protein